VFTRKTTANGKKPSIGTDCKTSRKGNIMLNALRLCAMYIPSDIENTNESKYAHIIRINVLAMS
jgi:hypothetical protein